MFVESELQRGFTLPDKSVGKQHIQPQMSRHIDNPAYFKV